MFYFRTPDGDFGLTFSAKRAAIPAPEWSGGVRELDVDAISFYGQRRAQLLTQRLAQCETRPRGAPREDAAHAGPMESVQRARPNTPKPRACAGDSPGARPE